MSAENVPKKTQDATNLTNVALASGGDKGQPRKNMTSMTNVTLVNGDDKILYSCTMCDKTYDKKSSYHSHMRTKHRATKESDVEKETKTTQKNKGISFSQWIENETERPLLLTRDLDSFLNNQSDASLVGAVRDSEEIAVQVEKLGVKNHEVEWFEEDNMEEFEEDFRSDFASSLRESLPPKQPANNLAIFHNELMKKQHDKYDSMVVKTTKLLNAAEIQKKHLRKTAKDLMKELEETRENWQGATEADAEEISSLKATVTAQKIRIEELELLTSEPDIANQKCGKCSFAASDSKQLGKHMKQSHGHGKICAQCGQVFADETKMRKHKDKHHKAEWQFACEVCKKTFKTVNDARDHAIKPCGSIKPREVVIDIEEVDDTHRCNACSISFNNNNSLEKHMEKEHQLDCTLCHATFKTKDDV